MTHDYAGRHAKLDPAGRWRPGTWLRVNGRRAVVAFWVAGRMFVRLGGPVGELMAVPDDAEVTE